MIDHNHFSHKRQEKEDRGDGPMAKSHEAPPGMVSDDRPDRCVDFRIEVMLALLQLFKPFRRKKCHV
eukprot:CAMPEP_0171611030 /NCGR_PEP_ID=MMETSP0990-20121206/10388_1 /TAXON_ID=483369 /ORGANISM="non described non described, Strain CCMP2098" /LENGTH=66 /DNA_ID=CAMNT_0012174525 /DNA_START=319 /DNA_END=519 /DNA_ORIENTATION=+